ncbi:MAG: SIS domain-containing protein, partial [Methylophilaceae bacterium]
LSQDIQLITAMAQTNDLAQLYSRQISALGEEGDVLFAMCMSGESDNVTQAILRARENGLQVIAMVGGDGGEMMQALQDTDILISVASHEIARVQEIFILVIHCICDAVDSILLGVE